MIEIYSTRANMSMNLVILGRPPGRALFNVKSRTLRVLTIAFLLMKTQCYHHGNSSHFQFFHFFIEQDARTYTNSKTRYELRKELTLRYSHTSHTLGVCKTPSVWSSSLLCSCSFVKTYRCVVVSVALISVGVACPSFFLIFPWKG